MMVRVITKNIDRMNISDMVFVDSTINYVLQLLLNTWVGKDTDISTSKTREYWDIGKDGQNSLSVQEKMKDMKSSAPH